MRITAVKAEPQRLILETPDMSEAVRLSYSFAPGDYELRKIPKKRSIDANAYCWVLIDMLAAELRLSKVEVYRMAIKDIGGVSETVCVKDEAVDNLRSGWEHNGIGWQTDVFPSKLPGCSNVVLYYGSSTYDTKQMSVLIDHIIQDCKAVGIETLTPEELSRLMEGWHERKD